MVKLFLAFVSLYFAILLLSLGTGLYNTFMALRLAHDGVSQSWIGLLISAYYFGLVLGVRLGHQLIVRIGHIRAYAASAAVVTVMVLAQTLVPGIHIWLGFRVVVGVAMVIQYMVIESWLSDQSESENRGSVFSFYMVMSSLGIVLGQMSVALFPNFSDTSLNLVAISTALCLIPVALTRRASPILKSQAPLNMRLYISMVPIPIVVLFLGGSITGAFYGLAAVFAAHKGLSPSEVSTFLSACVMAGLLAQWPMGWLSDRYSRLKLIRINAYLLALACVPLLLMSDLSYSFLLAIVAFIGILQFTFYPLAVAYANERIGTALRVGLSGALLLSFSVGAALGPVLAGLIMDSGGADMLYAFTGLAALALAVFLTTQRSNLSPLVTSEGFVPMAVDVQPAPVVFELDPRVDLESDISADLEAIEQVRELMQQDDEVSILPNLNLVDEIDFVSSDASRSTSDEPMVTVTETNSERT